MINAFIIFLLFQMLTASLFLNLYHETFPAVTMSACELKEFHLNTNTPVLTALRPVLHAFWQSEFAPICVEEQVNIIDTVVQATQSMGRFLDTIIENTVLPAIPLYITKMYRIAVQAAVASFWDPVHFKESLVTFTSTVEACIPADVKQA